MYIKPNIHYIYPKYPQINLRKTRKKNLNNKTNY